MQWPRIATWAMIALSQGAGESSKERPRLSYIFAFFLSISSLKPGQHLERSDALSECWRLKKSRPGIYIYGVKQFRSWSRMFKGLKRKRLWYHLSSEDLSSWLEQSVRGGQGEGQAEGTGKRQGHDCLCVPRGMCTKWTAPGSLRPSHWHVLHPACIPLVALWSISTESKSGPDNT